jgi:hypothetical protein
VVRGVVSLKIIRLQSLRKLRCLMKAQTQTIAADGVHAAGRVANKRHLATINAIEVVHRGYCSSISARRLRPV